MTNKADLTLSHWLQDGSEPVLDRTMGDALRNAATTWSERVALIEGVLFAPGEHVAIWAANCPE